MLIYGSEEYAKTQSKMAKQINEQAHAIERLMELANNQNNYIEDYSERTQKMLDPDTTKQDLLSKLRSLGIAKEGEAYLTSLKGWKSLKK